MVVINLTDTISTDFYAIMYLRHYISLFVAFGLCSCEIIPTVKEADLDIVRNYDFFCNTLEREYAFNNVDAEYWQILKSDFRQRAAYITEDSILFNLLAELSDSLKDGHISIESPTSSYHCFSWRDGQMVDYIDSIARKTIPNPETIGKITLFGIVPGTEIAYFRYPDFNKILTKDNYRRLDAIFGIADGIIIDIRSNYGGNIIVAEALASHFYSETTLIGFNHFGISDSDKMTYPCIITPSATYNWSGIPIIILIDGSTYSAANYFVLCMKQSLDVVTIGGKSGGGAGFAVTRELPNGWLFSFPVGDTLNPEMQSIDKGLYPDCEVHLDSASVSHSCDNIIETALSILNNRMPNIMDADYLW